jgi:molecular chaperone GrpE
MEHRTRCIMDDAESDSGQAGTGDSGCVKNPPRQSLSVPAEPDIHEKALAEMNDRYLRLVADFENFKKRSARERESVISMANERFAADMLEVVDNFDRALKTNDAHLREGVLQIRQLLSTQLQRHGITSIDSLNKPFNPQEHEAIAHIPSEEPEGTVIDEISCGYRMDDRILRHAKVAVSKGKQKDQET